MPQDNLDTLFPRKVQMADASTQTHMTIQSPQMIYGNLMVYSPDTLTRGILLETPMTKTPLTPVARYISDKLKEGSPLSQPSRPPSNTPTKGVRQIGTETHGRENTSASLSSSPALSAVAQKGASKTRLTRLSSYS